VRRISVSTRPSVAVLVAVVAVLALACNPTTGTSSTVGAADGLSYASPGAWRYTGTDAANLQVEVTSAAGANVAVQVTRRNDSGVPSVTSPWVPVWTSGTLDFVTVLPVVKGDTFGITFRSDGGTDSLKWSFRTVDAGNNLVGGFLQATFDLPLGGSGNGLGRDPDLDPLNLPSRTGAQPTMWLNVGAPANMKSNGDEFTSSDCTTTAPSSAAPCGGPGVGTNPEFDPNGYTYAVDVTNPGQPLDIQAFDPAAVDVEDYCSGNLVSVAPPNGGGASPMDKLIAQYTAAGLIGTAPGQVSDPFHRWAQAPTSPTASFTAADIAQSLGYCNGSWVHPPLSGTGPNTKTTWIVRAPDSTPYVNTDNPPLCAITFDSYGVGNFTDVVNNRLSASTNPNWNTDDASGTEKVAFWKHFRQWFTLCHVPAAQAGSYIVQVTQDADVSNLGATPQTTATPGLDLGTLGAAATGANQPVVSVYHRFSLRAGESGAEPASPTAVPGSSFDPVAWAAGVTLRATNRLAVFNSTSGSGSWALARITSADAGQTVTLHFWDVGDGANMSLNLAASADIAPTTPFTCSWQRDDESSASFPATVSGAGNCTASGLVSNNLNGHMVTALVHVDPSYACNDADPAGCSIRLIETAYGNANDTFSVWGHITGH
jgi:hypothetical protein